MDDEIYMLREEVKRLREENRMQLEQIERAFQALELFGVPQERARNIPNGIDVIVARMAREKNPLLCYGISEAAIDEVLRVLEHGDQKHPGMEWKDITSYVHVTHAEDHMYMAEIDNHQYLNVEIESGCYHLAHAITRLLFALSQDLEGK